jgi:DNA-binding MarR family transcriptional regulator
MDSKRVFDLIERIGALVRSDGRRQAMPHELQPVHLQALDYLSRANRFSDTPLAVGEYLGLTKGNMSQRLNVLERLDLVRKIPDAEDGRVVHLRLTAAAKRLLEASHPPPSWYEAENKLTSRNVEDLEAGLDALLRALVVTNGYRSFEACKTCRYHERRGKQGWCALLSVELDAEDSQKICREHEPVT